MGCKTDIEQGKLYVSLYGKLNYGLPHLIICYQNQWLVNLIDKCETIVTDCLAVLTTNLHFKYF